MWDLWIIWLAGSCPLCETMKKSVQMKTESKISIPKRDKEGEHQKYTAGVETHLNSAMHSRRWDTDRFSHVSGRGQGEKSLPKSVRFSSLCVPGCNLQIKQRSYPDQQTHKSQHRNTQHKCHDTMTLLKDCNSSVTAIKDLIQRNYQVQVSKSLLERR